MRPPEVLDQLWMQLAADPRDADATAAVLAECEASPLTLGTLGWLEASRLSEVGRVDRLVALRKHIAYLQALQTAMLAEFAADREADEFAAMQVAPGLLVSQRSASARMTDAAYVTRVLPELLALHRDGSVTEAHVRSLVEEVRNLPEDVVRAVLARVLPRAAGQSLPRFRAVVRKAVAAVDARGQEAKHAAALDESRVSVSPAPDGMGEVWAFLPAEHAQRVFRAVDHVAGSLTVDGDPRSADQRRADALTAIADAVLAGRMSDIGAAKPEDVPTVLIPVATLFGGSMPGELAGHGPISASHARAIAVAAAQWRIAVTDQHGRVLVRSATTYKVPKALKQTVRLRDQRCVFPGCTARAMRCDTDHIIPWPEGPTHQNNLHALCRRHHRVKHRTRWSVTRDPDNGTTTWHSPTGHLYPEEPPELPGEW